MCSYVCIKCMAIFSVLKTKPNKKLFSYATFGPYTNSSTVGLQQCGETVNMFRQLVQFEAFLRKWKTIQKFLIQKYSHIMRNGQCVSMQKAFFQWISLLVTKYECSNRTIEKQVFSPMFLFYATLTSLILHFYSRRNASQVSFLNLKILDDRSLARRDAQF